jgi:hypothetical protein
MSIRPTADTAWQRLLRAALLLVVCALGGTFDILNNNFSRWVARIAAFPEEEESVGKDRASLVAAAQPSRRGTLRPRTPAADPHRGRRPATLPSRSPLLHVPATARFLTGAGIYQHC